MEIVRARIDVIFDELARLPPLPVAVPVAATHNQQRKCTAAWLYEHPQDAQLYSLGPTCAPWYQLLASSWYQLASSWYRKMDLGASDHASALPLTFEHILRASPFGFGSSKTNTESTRMIAVAHRRTQKPASYRTCILPLDSRDCSTTRANDSARSSTHARICPSMVAPRRWRSKHIANVQALT